MQTNTGLRNRLRGSLGFFRHTTARTFAHRATRSLPLLLALTFAQQSLRADNGTKQVVDMNYVEALAEKLAGQKWKSPAEKNPVPDILKKLTYDQYRNIRFIPANRLWTSEELPFRLSLFHLGYLFTEPVEIHEFTAQHSQRIRFAPQLFDYTNSGINGADLPDDLNYAGLRLHYQLNSPDVFDELGVFQGASYFRLLGREQIYGASARGLALNTGLDAPEEFPIFTRFWVGKPKKDDKKVIIYALLDSPSVTGAYEFIITPGTDTTADVRQTVYFRNAVTSLGIAPISSMFWFGENTTKPFDDFRPEVHDSDGLAMQLKSGEFIWRPLENKPGRKRILSFEANDVKGFGLLQRDRDFRNYQDLEALYHRRPGIWIEPVGDWGEGSVKLVEIPTVDELMDNIVVFWEPLHKPEPRVPYRLAYRQTWTLEQNPGLAGGYAVATRTGTHHWEKGSRYVKVDFVGNKLDNLPLDVQLTADITVADPRVEVMDVTVQRNYIDKSWRVSFRLKPKDPNNAPEAVETRCFIRRGDDVLTETWSSLITL